MENIILLYKPIGKTPLQCIEQFKKEHPPYINQKMCYAGRLDPMADGLLIILVNETCKMRKTYENLPKTYTCDVLYGIETDTYDSLGIITAQCRNMTNEVHHQKMISSFLGRRKQKYPPYSSAHVKGKPLFWWARHHKLHEIEIPSKDIEIYSIKTIRPKNTPRLLYFKDIQKEVFDRVSRVDGDFRQNEIRKSWGNLFCSPLYQMHHFVLHSFSVSCSAGTYIRSLVHELGKKTETGALAWRITRTALDEYHIKNAVHLTWAE